MHHSNLVKKIHRDLLVDCAEPVILETGEGLDDARIFVELVAGGRAREYIFSMPESTLLATQVRLFGEVFVSVVAGRHRHHGIVSLIGYTVEGFSKRFHLTMNDGYELLETSSCKQNFHT